MNLVNEWQAQRSPFCSLWWHHVALSGTCSCSFGPRSTSLPDMQTVLLCDITVAQANWTARLMCYVSLTSILLYLLHCFFCPVFSC